MLKICCGEHELNNKMKWNNVVHTGRQDTPGTRTGHTKDLKWILDINVSTLTTGSDILYVSVRTEKLPFRFAPYDCP